MASWSELRRSLDEPGPLDRIGQQLHERLKSISKRKGGATVLFYASAFLQKPTNDTNIAGEDMNGFMNALYQVPTGKGLVLMLHTPGGDANAVESIVEYLHAKFKHITVIVPYLAMSGGAMISLSSDLLILGKPSQLGPTDAQLRIGNTWHSARAVQEGFDRAKKGIQENVTLAHLWAPILQNMGPSLILEAEKALSYSKELVMKWLDRRMFKDIENERERGNRVKLVASYFNAEKEETLQDHDGKEYIHTHDEPIHVHGQRIGVKKLQQLKVKLELLEVSQQLQDDVLTAYHLMTILFENTPSLKFIASVNKLWATGQSPQPVAVPLAPAVLQQPPG